METIKRAILKTLVYADIFEYPLREGEIWKYLITKKKLDGLKNSKPVGLRQFDSSLEKLASGGLIKLKDGFYFLRKRREIIGLRKKREKWSREKIKKAEKIANLLKIIPTVKLVGISGALAMENCDEDDDIDLFIITSSGRLWLTRFLVTLLVELTGQRRKPSPKYKIQDIRYKTQDKICLNMFVDESHLVIPPKERNLFTAHEVVQMRKIWDRERMYDRFLAANLWVRKWLGNAIEISNIKYQISKIHIKNKKERKNLLLHCYIVKWLNCLEEVAMRLQLKYMAKRRTTEKISSGRILFHPEDKSKWVMREYRKRIANLNSSTLRV